MRFCSIPTLFILCVALLAGTGCGSDNPATPSDPNTPDSKKRLLVGKTWKTEVERQGVYNTTGFGLLRRTFHENGTFEATHLSGPQSGSWSITGDGTNLIIDGNTWRIVEISDNILGLMALPDDSNPDTLHLWAFHEVGGSAVVPEDLTDKVWHTEMFTMEGIDNTDVGAARTIYHADGTWESEFDGGGTKSGKWEFGNNKKQIIMDKGKAVELTWDIIELKGNRLEISTPAWNLVATSDNSAHKGGKNDILVGKKWTVESYMLNERDLSGTLASTIEFGADGKSTVGGNHWLMRNNQTVLQWLNSYWDIVELTATSVTIRRPYDDYQGNVGLAVLKLKN